MNLSAKKFIQLLDEKNLAYEVEERESDTVVTCEGKWDNTSVRVRIFIDDDNQHVALRCFGIAEVAQSKIGNALITCNECNAEYRWVKFVLDEDSEITAHDDAVISPDTAGEEIFELLVRMMGVVDQCYPKFMKSMWG